MLKIRKNQDSTTTPRCGGGRILYIYIGSYTGIYCIGSYNLIKRYFHILKILDIDTNINIVLLYLTLHCGFPLMIPGIPWDTRFTCFRVLVFVAY